MTKPPWISTASSMFPIGNKSQGNLSESSKIYRSDRWKKARGKEMGQSPFGCVHDRCIDLATVIDHIIPIKIGGAVWDKRNWQKLCDKHHNKKRGQERHGIIEEWVETAAGKIPKRNQHLKPEIAGQSYLIQ